MTHHQVRRTEDQLAHSAAESGARGPSTAGPVKPSHSAAESACRSPAVASSQALPRGEHLPISPRKKKLSYKEQRDLDSMESNIETAESLLASLTHEISLPENAANATKLLELTTSMAAAQKEIDRLYARWSELTGKT